MEKLDPKQVFIVRSWSREEIAHELNEIIAAKVGELEGTKIKAFDADDPRLTDEVCEEFCDAIEDAIAEEDGVVDRQYELHIDLLVANFG